MLRLWRYIPLRQRNMREMELNEHLVKKADGTWHLTFRGEQLKVASKRGKINVFTVPFPEPLTPVLEEYLRVWRPILLRKAGAPSNHVFLNNLGKPYIQVTLYAATSTHVYHYTGKYWHPHIIRTVWATEMIHKGLDLLKVAEMLNDRFETVVANYSHLLHKDFAAKAYELLDQRNGQGK